MHVVSTQKDKHSQMHIPHRDLPFQIRLLTNMQHNWSECVECARWRVKSCTLEIHVKHFKTPFR